MGRKRKLEQDKHVIHTISIKKSLLDELKKKEKHGSVSPKISKLIEEYLQNNAKNDN